MCFAFKKNNKQTKKPVNCFLQDGASAGIQSLQTSIEIKLCQNPSDGLYVFRSLKGAAYHFSNFEGLFTFSNSLYLKT